MSLAISMSAFITDTLNVVDQVIGDFVEKGWHILVADNQAEILLMCILYVIIVGYRAIRFDEGMDLAALSKHLLVLLLVYVLVSDWEMYHMFLYDIFTNQPNYFINSMARATDNSDGLDSVTNALDQIFVVGIQASFDVLATIKIYNIDGLILGLLLFLVTLLGCLIAVALLIYAKMALAVMLFIGPLFLGLALFKSTRGFFEKWLQQCFNYALIPIVTFGVLMLILSVLHGTIPGLIEGIETQQQTFFSAVPYLGIFTLGFYLLLQVMGICASLGGGLSLAGLGGAASMVGSTWRNSGAQNMAHRFGNAAQQKAATFKENLAKERLEKAAKLAAKTELDKRTSYF